jgi:acyl-coenzyme A thioesterase PaaI-like protein
LQSTVGQMEYFLIFNNLQYIINLDELTAFLAEVFPHSREVGIPDAITETTVTLRLQPTATLLRPGNTVSRPTMMALTNLTTYANILRQIGPRILALTTNLNINSLRKPMTAC